MKLNKIWGFLLLFLIACGSELAAVPTQDFQPTPVVEPEINLCEGVRCLGDNICQAGECVCPTGQKSCGSDCIATTACCTDDDCDVGVCSDNECQDIKCEYNQIWKEGECTCGENMKYCAEQNKCIPRDSCCVHSLCTQYEKCIPTKWSTQFCVEQSGKATCKGISEILSTIRFSFGGGKDLAVEALQWHSDGSIKFLVNNEDYLIPQGTKVPHTNTTLLEADFYHEGIEQTGGYCKLDE